MRFDTLIFDAEGVVIDTEGAWDKAQQRLLARYGERYERDRVKHLLTGRSSAEGIAVLKRIYSLTAPVDQLAQERLALMREILSEYVRFMPGFKGFFAAARRRYKTCLATAMDESLLAVVRETLHLKNFFGDRIFSLSDVGYRSKPDPALFLFAAARLGSRPRRCVVIEDSPYGLLAAKRAGMVAVGMATTYEPERLVDADVIVRSYADLRLDRLYSPAASAALRAVAVRG